MIIKDEITATLFKRIIRRFCNMMAAETIKKFRRSHQLKRSSALRQGLQARGTKKSKQSQGIPTISSIITEPHPKSATHFSLKALAYKSDTVFECYSHMDIDFIMMGYNLPPSHDNKKRKSKILVETLKVTDIMPCPEQLCQQHYSNMKTIRKTTTAVDTNQSIQGSGILEHSTTSNSRGI